MAAQQNPPSATNAERAESNSAGDLELNASISQPNDPPQEAHRGVGEAMR